MAKKFTHYEVPLQIKDIKILRELNFDSRQSFSKISKKVGLPKTVVAYRVKRLIEKGILTLFCTTLDRPALGKMYCRLFLKFRMFSDNLEANIIFSVKSLTNIHWVARLDGIFDFCIVFLADSVAEADNIYRKLIYSYGSELLDKEFSIASEIRFLPYNYIYPKKIERVYTSNVSKMANLDDLDRQIINSIKEDSRKPLLDTVNELGVSAQTIRMRIKKLTEKKIITGFNIRIDPTKLGLFHFHTFLTLAKISQHKVQQLKEFLGGENSTTQIISGFGRFDLEFESFLPTQFVLHNLIRSIHLAFPENIMKSETVYIYKIYPINTVRY